ncbi:hypothetical protein FG87_20230 [Nocardia vulneris]|uniref:FHA domain-containing protein n=1 Tax=Nocardia vulneris TaxID=1141657 RepID=A0ABR4ZD52_9NOCA|nr:hypothetical protein FG87_20230 [Nocardia vulneris]
MRSKPSTVGIAPGNGLVARFGGIVVYLSGETASTERILGTIEAVAEFDRPGAALAQRLAAVVFAGTAEPQHFGVLAPTDDGTLILLRGPVFAEINGAEGTRRLDGTRAFTWVDEIVREPFRRITIGAAGTAALKALPRTDLRAGIAPGGGFVLNAALRRAAKTPRRPAETPPPAVDLTAHRARTRPASSTSEPEPTTASAGPHANTNDPRAATPTDERGRTTTSGASDTRANANRSRAVSLNSAREQDAVPGVSNTQQLHTATADGASGTSVQRSDAVAAAGRSSGSSASSASSGTAAVEPDSAAGITATAADPAAQQLHTATATTNGASGSSAQRSNAVGTERSSAKGAGRTPMVEPEPTAAAGITVASATGAAGKRPRATSVQGGSSKQPAAAEGNSADIPLDPTAAAGFAAASDSSTEAAGAGPKGTAAAKRQSASSAKKAGSPSASGSAGARPTISTDELEATAASGFGATPEPTGESDAVAPSAGTRSSTNVNAEASPAEADRPRVGSSSNIAGTQSVSPGSDAPSKTAGRSSATPGASAAAQGGSAAYPRRPGRPLPRPRPPIGSKAAADRPLAWSQARQPGGRPEPVALHRPSENRGLRVMRPVLDRAVGALILENGTAYPLDRPYVIGRGPQADDAVRAATAAPIVIQRDRHVSRVHAYVSVDDGKVFVRDATATSGTFIAPPGTDQWTRITTSPTELRPGWSVRISDRVLTYRPDDRPAS